jgi:hypothetical protein
MSYTITVTFPQDTVGSNTVQMILIFTVNDTGSNQNVSSGDQNLAIEKYGRLKWEFDLENTLLMPGELSSIIIDPNSYISNLIFENTLTEKQFEVQIKVDGTTDFIGIVPDNEARWDEGTKILNFKAIPQLDILNRTAIYDDDGNPLDPLGLSTGDSESISAATWDSGTGLVTVTHASNANFNDNTKIFISGVTGMTDLNRAFEIYNEVSNTQFEIELETDQTYVSGGTVQIMSFGLNKTIYTILDEIYQFVDSSIVADTATFTIDGPGWDLLYGAGVQRDISNAVSTDGDTKVQVTTSGTHGLSVSDEVMIREVVGMTDLNDIWTVTDIVDTTNYKVGLATAQSYTSGGTSQQVNTAVWDDETYMLCSNLFGEADAGVSTLADLLKKLAIDWFCYTGLLHQRKAFFYKLYHYDSGNLQTLGDVHSHQKGYKYPLYKYVKISQTFGASRNKYFDAGDFTVLDSSTLKRENTLPWLWWLSGFGSTNVSQWNGSGVSGVDYVKDDDWDSTVDGYIASGQLLANLWHQYRSEMLPYNRADKFLVDGIEYNPIDGFNYDSKKYWPVKLEKDLDGGQSRFEAIYLGST